MKRRLWVLLHCFMAMGCCFAIGAEDGAEEETIPMTTRPPPEGNTTFLDGTTWCVALDGASQVDLQTALDWACGPGKANCGPIQSDGPCFEPNTLSHHASYAFNNYYQQNGNNDIACYFGGTATLTKIDPSYGRCAFDASGFMKSSASQLANTSGWKLAVALSFLFLVC